jgi:hypothetical protein
MTAESPTAPAPVTSRVAPGRGHDPAAERGEQIERCVGGDLDQAALVDHGVVGEARLAEEVTAERDAATGDRRRPVGSFAADEVRRQPGVAVGGVAVAAVRAAAARGVAQQHLVTRGDLGDRGADRLDDSGALVAEHAGQREGQVTARDAEVGVADAGGGDPDAHLVRAQVVQRHLGEHEPGTGGLDDGRCRCCGHGVFSWKFR